MIYLIGLRTPVQRSTIVNVDLLGGIPLDAVGEAECPLLTRKRAQGRAHAGIDFRAGCQTRIVMGFRKIDRDTVAVRDVDGLGQVVFNLSTLIILKQL